LIYMHSIVVEGMSNAGGTRGEGMQPLAMCKQSENRSTPTPGV
jgi:hypothetical protein